MASRLQSWLTALLCLATVPALGQPALALRYRFTPGETLTYETVTTAEGQLGLHAEQGDQGLPINMRIEDRTSFRVLEVDDTGMGRIEVRLRRLTLAVPTGLNPMVLELIDTAEGVQVKRGAQVTTLPPLDPAKADAAPPPGLEAFGKLDPRRLFVPMIVRLEADGSLIAKSDKLWFERLAEVPFLSGLAALLQPFGSLVPELPEKPLSLGASWQQARELPLPGGTDQTYPMDVEYDLVERGVAGPYEVVRIDFAGNAEAADKSFTFEALPGVHVPMALETLVHAVRGQTVFALERGRFVEQQLSSQITTTAHGQADAQAFTITGTISVESAVTLLQAEDPAPGA